MKRLLLSTLLVLTCMLSYSQQNISGIVYGITTEITSEEVTTRPAPLAGAIISTIDEVYQTSSDVTGAFSIEIPDSYRELIISHPSYITATEKIKKNKSLKIQLRPTTDISAEELGIAGSMPSTLDEAFLSEITIRAQRDQSSSISTLRSPSNLSLDGTADLLTAVPGIFSDASTGEVFSRVYSRGISLSAEDDIGWYYNALQEDGLPLSAVQYNYFSPDLFMRPDVSYRQTEVIKGGRSGIIAQNSPGTLVNFISQRPSDSYRSRDIITGGIHQNGQLYGRIEGYNGGPIGSSDWSYDMSYLYRYDRGDRDIPYALNKGGQFKLGLFKDFKNGVISARFKYLKDQTNRYTGVAATDWTDPQPAFDHDFRSTALFPPAMEGAMIPDGRAGTNSYEYDPANGIQSKEIAGQINADFSWDGWRLTNKLKYSAKSLDWQTVIGGQPLGLENFLSYFVSGDAFPVGAVDFTDVSTGQSLALVNNAGILNAFAGLPPTFEYLSGSLPNDAIMGTGAWKKDDQINEIMNDLRLTKEIDGHSLTGGLFFARSSVDIFTNASFIYSTYEAQPRLLEVSLSSPDAPTRALSDAFGLSNYGGLLYEQADFSVSQIGTYFNWDGQLSESLRADIGMRYENIRHDGTKANFAPSTSSETGGVDSDPLTGYDNGLLATTNEDQIDYTYENINFSLGLLYNLSAQTNIYARYSATDKAPELNYYINNFSNVPVNQKAATQQIDQLEIGLIGQYENQSIQATIFHSRLSDVPYSNFEFDEDSNMIFYTPTQLNATRTIGLELSYLYQLSTDWSISTAMTIQDAQLEEFSVYNANESIDPADDFTTSFDDNTLPHQPNLMGNISLHYDADKIGGTLRLNYMGSRYGNFENSFELPAYSTVDMSLRYQLSKTWDLGLRATNLFNSVGLNNFFGPNEFGSSSNAATADYINANPAASFVVFPISGRSVYLSVGYTFGG